MRFSHLRVVLAYRLATPDARPASHRYVPSTLSLSRTSGLSDSRPRPLRSDFLSGLVRPARLGTLQHIAYTVKAPYVNDMLCIMAPVWHIGVHVSNAPQEDMRWATGHAVGIILTKSTI